MKKHNRHQQSPEHRHRSRRLKSALRADWSSMAMALLSRLERCGGPDWGYRYTCRSPACPACRDRYVARERRAAARRFAGARGDEMAMVSIVLGAVRSVEEVGAAMAKARRDLRNLIDRQRRTSGLWGPVEVLVWLETDAIDPEGYACLGPDKRAQIAEFLPVPGEANVIWVPSLHGIVRLGPALDIGQARAVFERQWPGYRQVDLRAFHTARTLDANLSGIANYACKHRCTTEYYDVETGEISLREWETSWLCTYYAWLHEWSRGFQSLRVSIKPKRVKPSLKTDLVVDKENIDLDPLPMTYSFSAFHRDYKYWS